MERCRAVNALVERPQTFLKQVTELDCVVLQRDLVYYRVVEVFQVPGLLPLVFGLPADAIPVGVVGGRRRRLRTLLLRLTDLCVAFFFVIVLFIAFRCTTRRSFILTCLQGVAGRCTLHFQRELLGCNWKSARLLDLAGTLAEISHDLVWQ